MSADRSEKIRLKREEISWVRFNVSYHIDGSPASRILAILQQQLRELESAEEEQK